MLLNMGHTDGLGLRTKHLATAIGGMIVSKK